MVNWVTVAKLLADYCVRKSPDGKLRCLLCNAELEVKEARRGTSIYSIIYRHFLSSHWSIVSTVRDLGCDARAVLYLLSLVDSRGGLVGESARSLLKAKLHKIVNVLCSDLPCSRDMLIEVFTQYVNALSRDLKLLRDISYEDIVRLVDEVLDELKRKKMLIELPMGRLLLKRCSQ